MGYAVQITSIHKQFPGLDKEVLKGISFDISSGQKIGILGPNGAGKTTLISIICGLLKPSSGSVHFYDAKKESVDQVTQKIGLVPQEYAFYEKLTPIQNLNYFGALYHLDPKAVKKESAGLLKVLGLEKFAHKKVKSFSGGMKRRLNLAIGLIHKPQIIFLDEPTVGVDVQSKNAIINFLDQLNDKGVTIVYTSHHLNEAQHFCNHVILIDNGVVIEDKEMKKLLEENDGQNLQEIFIAKTGGQYRD